MKNIHASCVCWRKKGILVLGDSGLGKSDLCLRMIINKQARLVSDDRVDLDVINNKLQASPPKTLEGLLEVRGLGILSFPYQKKCDINLVVSLVSNREDIDRYPEGDYFEFQGLKIPQIKLYSFDASSPDKAILGLSINKHRS